MTPEEQNTQADNQNNAGATPPQPEQPALQPEAQPNPEPMTQPMPEAQPAAPSQQPAQPEAQPQAAAQPPQPVAPQPSPTQSTPAATQQPQPQIVQQPQSTPQTNLNAYNQPKNAGSRKKLFVGLAGVGVLGVLVLVALLFILPALGGLKIDELKTIDDNEVTYKVPSDWVEEEDGNLTAYHPEEPVATEDGEDKYDALVVHAKETLGGKVSDLSAAQRSQLDSELSQQFNANADALIEPFTDEICASDVDASDLEETEVEGAYKAYGFSFTCTIDTNGQESEAEGKMLISLPNNYDRLDIFGYVTTQEVADSNRDKLSEIYSSLMYQ